MMTGRNIKKSSIKKILNLCVKVTNQISATTSIHPIYLSFGTQLISHYFDSYTALDTFEQYISYFYRVIELGFHRSARTP